LLIKLF